MMLIIDLIRYSDVGLCLPMIKAYLSRIEISNYLPLVINTFGEKEIENESESQKQSRYSQ